MNVSANGVALRFGADFAGARVGDRLETALMAPRQSVIADGIVVSSQQTADSHHVSVSFCERPAELPDLIRTALSGAYQEFAGSSVIAHGAEAATSGWLCGSLAKDIEHIARTCRIVNLAAVRHVDLDGLAALADARRRFGITVYGCNDRVARVIRDNYARSLCAAECVACPGEGAAGATAPFAAPGTH